MIDGLFVAAGLVFDFALRRVTARCARCGRLAPAPACEVEGGGLHARLPDGWTGSVTTEQGQGETVRCDRCRLRVVTTNEGT